MHIQTQGIWRVGIIHDQIYTQLSGVEIVLPHHAFWFSQQALELAVLFKETENVDFAKADARQFVGRQLTSASGFQAVHQWPTQNGKLGQAPQGGGSCDVK